MVTVSNTYLANSTGGEWRFHAKTLHIIILQLIVLNLNLPDDKSEHKPTNLLSSNVPQPPHMNTLKLHIHLHTHPTFALMSWLVG